MVYNTFELFLNRNKAEIERRFEKQLAPVFPNMPPQELAFINTQLIEFFIGRLLGNLKVEDDLSQEVIAGTLEKKVSPEIMENNINSFFSILKSLGQIDPELSADQRQHIQRVLEQSHKFLLTNIFLVKSKNLKKE